MGNDTFQIINDQFLMGIWFALFGMTHFKLFFRLPLLELALPRENFVCPSWNDLFQIILLFAPFGIGNS